MYVLTHWISLSIIENISAFNNVIWQCQCHVNWQEPMVQSTYASCLRDFRRSKDSNSYRKRYDRKIVQQRLPVGLKLWSFLWNILTKIALPLNLEISFVCADDFLLISEGKRISKLRESTNKELETLLRWSDKKELNFAQTRQRQCLFRKITE